MDRHPEKLSRRASLREMAQIALPMVVSQSCDTIMIFTDRVFLSRLAPEFMNAAMGGGLTAFVMMSFFIGLTGYTTALVAQNLGAGRKDGAAKVVTQSLVVSLGAYPVVLACAPLAWWAFKAMRVPAEQLGPQIDYVNILLYGVLISLVRNTLAGFFSGIGRTRIVMAASVVSMLANVGLNYLLIYGHGVVPAMGIRGAAYGTLTGGFLGMLILVAAYLRKENRHEFQIRKSFSIDFGLMKTFLRYGTPTGLELFWVVLGFNAMVLLYHGQGVVTATAATIVLNWDLVSFIPLVGIEIGTTSLVGRYMGARRPDLAHQATLAGIQIGLMYSAVILVLFAGFPEALVRVFRPDGSIEVFAAAVPTAVWMVRWASLYVLIEAAFITLVGALRGAGDTLWAMGLSVTMHWLMVLAAWLILDVWGGSPKAAWMSMIILFGLSFFVVVARYRGGRWKTLQVVEHPPLATDIDPFHEPREG